MEAVHVAVPGRIRIRVEGLQNDPKLKQNIELGLTGAHGVHAVSASDVTGNVLVRFDPERSTEQIVRDLDRVLRGEAIPAMAGEMGAREPWHCLSADEVAAKLGSSPHTGLTEEAASQRLEQVGKNSLPRPSARSGLSILVDQFAGAPVAMLGVASVVSLATGAVLEAAAILSVVFLNAAIGYVSESRAERTIEGLDRMGGQTARVIRRGVVRLVPVDTLVPGDLVSLQRGDAVPADARVVRARALTVSEALLTGESQPVSKSRRRLERTDVPLAARANLLYRGTVVTGGSGTALVVATGPQTEIGRIQKLVSSVEVPQTPMQRQLEGLGTQIAWLSIGIGAAIFGIGAVRGYAFLQVLRSALSLAVAAVPEGLPMMATTTLVFGVEEMRRRKLLIRRLDAVETLACVDMVCFDKTGTLTLNRMSVAAIATGQDVYRAPFGIFAADPHRRDNATCLRRLLSIGILCSETEIETADSEILVRGSSTESALVRAALDAGLDATALRRTNPLLSTQHRTEIYRFMATMHAQAGGIFVAVKGSPVELLRRCRFEETAAGVRELTLERRSEIERVNGNLANEALRVLGFAWTSVPHVPPDLSEVFFEELTWVGLAGLADPPRPGLHRMMSGLHAAGIHTVMITGDQPATAVAVATDVGLANGGGVVAHGGEDIDLMSDGELARAARHAHVFSRVSPAQKLRIITACQAAGAVVAMIGDGVNDSPALRSADVGIALGHEGTSAARDVADMVLETNELMSLVDAIERGRATRTNIRQSIHYLLSTNLSECVVMLSAATAGVAEAMTPLQLLWINLLTDVLPAIGLALEPAESGAMLRDPHSAESPIVARDEFPKLAGEAAFLSAGSLAALAAGALRYGGNSAQARTMAFGSLVLAQLLHALNYKASQDGAGANAPPLSRPLGRLLALCMAGQAAAFLTPFMRRLLGIAPLTAFDILVTLAGGVGPYLATQAVKAARHAGAPTSGRELQHSGDLAPREGG
jgi:Ca2+-transporting ATPase